MNQHSMEMCGLKSHSVSYNPSKWWVEWRWVWITGRMLFAFSVLRLRLRYHSHLQFYWSIERISNANQGVLPLWNHSLVDQDCGWWNQWSQGRYWRSGRLLSFSNRESTTSCWVPASDERSCPTQKERLRMICDKCRGRMFAIRVILVLLRVCTIYKCAGCDHEVTKEKEVQWASFLRQVRRSSARTSVRTQQHKTLGGTRCTLSTGSTALSAMRSTLCLLAVDSCESTQHVRQRRDVLQGFRECAYESLPPSYSKNRRLSLFFFEPSQRPTVPLSQFDLWIVCSN